MTAAAESGAVTVRPMVEQDLDEPEHFMGDADLIRTRWRANPAAAVVAEADGRIVGSNFAANWGSVGFFGPLTVEPAVWDRAIGRRLLDATMELFAGWGTAHVGLFTFAQSAKHVGLYQRYGFWPRYLTGIFTAPATPAEPDGAIHLSELSPADRVTAVKAAEALADAIHPGLDVTLDIEAVDRQRLGDTVVLHDASGVCGLAICHVGAGTEAGGGNCYIKFGGVRPGPDAERDFRRLVRACHALAAERGATVLVAGMNAGRDRAWRVLEDMGFRRDMQGVTMHRPNEPGYSTSDAFIIDDWR